MTAILVRKEIWVDMRGIYRRIARENHVSVREVKEEMQKAIDAAWMNPNKTQEVVKCQKEVSCRSEIPTVGEFLVYAKNKLR